MSLSNPLVSVIIPCYNVESYISECLDSALNQTHSNVEIICVDNNSTDRTVDILNNYKQNYFDKIQILFENQKGAPFARNKGLSLARGEWVQFLDADDLLLPNKIANQLSLLHNKLDNVGFVSGACIKQKKDNTKIVININQEDGFKALFVAQLGNTCSNLFSRDALLNIGGWSENHQSSQESDLMFRILTRDYLVIYDTVPLTIIREREGGQISTIDPAKNWVQFISLRLNWIEYLQSNRYNYFQDTKNYYYQNLFMLLRIIYKTDRNYAITVYNKYFARNFIPLFNGRINTYTVVFKLFGFRLTENIYHKIYN